MPIQRFNADHDFKTNNIIKIRRALDYLLYSEDDIAERIHHMIHKNGKHKLIKFGPSSVQEINGWVKPKEIPIRNKKADKAVKLLGFTC